MHRQEFDGRENALAFPIALRVIGLNRWQFNFRVNGEALKYLQYATLPLDFRHPEVMMTCGSEPASDNAFCAKAVALKGNIYCM